jgi:phage gpG-like protein
MGNIIEIKIDEKAAAKLARLDDLSKPLAAAAAAIDEENVFTVSHIQQKNLSYPKHKPAVATGLRVQSNRLRGSIRASKATVQGTKVQAGIGSNVVYAAIHEFGGQTAPHDIVPKKGKALKFRIGDRVVFARKVRHPGSTFPARRYVRGGIEDRANDYGQAVAAAIVGAMGGAQ